MFSHSALAQNLYFDPNNTNNNSGGSGSFNTSSFYNGTSDQLFTSGANAYFQNAPGTVTVDAPVTTGLVEVYITSPGDETIGTPGTTNAISINIAPVYSNAIQIDQTEGNLTFNAPVNFVLPNSTAYGIYMNNNSSNNITFNNVTFSGGADDYPGDWRIATGGTGSFTFNGAVSTTTGGLDNGITFNGGSNANTLTITSNASFNHAFIGANTGTIVTDTANLGTDNININGGQFVTGVAGLTITNGFQSGGTYTVGSNTAGNSTYTGTFALYGNTASLNLAAGAGAEVHIKTNGIYVAGSNTITINDPTQATPANIANPGVVSLEAPLFSNGHAQTTATHIANSSNATVDIANGTLLVNTGTTTDPVVAASVHISSATPGTPASGMTPAVAPTYTGTLAGTGVIGYQEFNVNTQSPGAFFTPVIADGPLSTIAPGDMTMVPATIPGGTPTFVSQVGTLTLAGGLTANNGLTMNFTLNGTGANSEIDTENGPVSLGGVLTFNFTNLGGALSTTTPYILIHSAQYAGAFDDGNVSDFVVNGPAGYIGTIGADVINQQQVIDVTFTAEAVPEPSTYALMGLGLLALAWSTRRLRCARS